MANYYEHYYQSPYEFNQVNNLYDHNHQYQQQEEIAYDPTSYYNNNYYYNNWNGSETDHETSSYYNWNGSGSDERSSASVAYSVSTISESKHLFYDPNYYYTTTYESPPQFSIYSSVQGFNESEFNEPEFDDYDPTPYGGGYDIVAAYGKPLPQSVVTCYPSLTAGQTKPPSPPEIITPVPLGIYDGGQKNVIKKRVTFSEPLEAKPLEPIKEQEEDEEEDDSEEEEDDSLSYGNGESGNNVDKGEVKALEEDNDGLRYGNGESGNNVEKGEVKALYVPSGYGLEATDLCEVIFGGYFPCVLRNKRRQEDVDRAAEVVSCWESNDSDPWKTTSDYLFGDSYPYGSENRVERNQFEISSFGYRSY